MRVVSRCRSGRAAVSSSEKELVSAGVLVFALRKVLASAAPSRLPVRPLKLAAAVVWQRDAEARSPLGWRLAVESSPSAARRREQRPG